MWGRSLSARAAAEPFSRRGQGHDQIKKDHQEEAAMGSGGRGGEEGGGEGGGKGGGSEEGWEDGEISTSVSSTTAAIGCRNLVET